MTTRAYPFHYNLSLSFREQLERAGFKVDLQVLDWAALVNRRSNRELWDVFVTHGVVFGDPAIRSPLSAAWPGWWESERKDRILAAIWGEPERERQKPLVRELQRLIREEVPWIQAGQFAELRAIRREVAGYRSFPQWFFWNCGFAGQGLASPRKAANLVRTRWNEPQKVSRCCRRRSVPAPTA